MMHLKTYKICDLTIMLRSPYPITEQTFQPKFKLFETDMITNPDVVINHIFGKHNKGVYVEPKCVYEQDQWMIYKDGDIWTYDYTPILEDDPGYPTTGQFHSNYTVCNMYSSLTREQYAVAGFNALTMFNTDQVLFNALLNDRDGLIVHGNGFDNGMLFIGESGSGKSTISAMLKADGYNVLTDDRMFVKWHENGFLMHGNWCHGSVPDVMNKVVPLKHIFFINQSDENAIYLLNSDKSLYKAMFKSIVKPITGKKNWMKMFNLLEEMVDQTDRYLLNFTLDGGIIKIIKDIL